MALTLKTKKRLTVVAQSIFFLLGGIEYAVVLPTLNEYIGNLGGDATFFGIVMASFSFSGVIVSPLYGLIQDHFKKTKVLILFANLWEIGGNFLYFIGGSKFVLLGSRLVSGVGAGVGSAIFAQISRTSTEKDRAAALSVASAARQVGLLIGPAFNLPLNSLNFYIGPFHVNNFSGPGILMCVLFIGLEIITLFCFYDIPPLSEQQENEEEEEKSVIPPTVGSIQANTDTDSEQDQRSVNRDRNGSLYDSPIAGGDRSQQLKGGREGQYGASNCNSVRHSEEVSPSTGQDTQTLSRIDVFLREEVLVLLTAQFVFMFNQTCLETGLTVMTKQLLNFGGVENSILYAIAGLELLVSLVIIKFISKFISDRTMLFGSLSLEIAPYILLLIFYPHAIPGRDRNMWWFGSLFIIQVSGLAFLLISIISLFSKVTPLAMQGFTQGIRRAVGGVGTIMGPLWAGCMENWPFETLTVMMVLFILVWFMTLLSWKRLRPHSVTAAESQRTPTSNNVDDETRPLLASGDKTDYGVA